jgi:hypothetical protein
LIEIIDSSGRRTAARPYARSTANIGKVQYFLEPVVPNSPSLQKKIESLSKNLLQFAFYSL